MKAHSPYALDEETELMNLIDKDFLGVRYMYMHICPYIFMVLVFLGGVCVCEGETMCCILRL